MSDAKLESLNELYNSLSDKLSKDLNADIASNDFTLNSFVPYGFKTLPTLDACIGRQGLPAGKIIEIFGFESSGKTTLAMLAAADCQAKGGAVLWIDTEKTFSHSRASQVGMVTKSPYLICADCNSVESIFRTIESTLEMLKEVNWQSPFMVVVDSITGVATEYEKKMEFEGESRVGHEAKQIRAGMKRVVSLAAEAKVPMIFINHSISQIGRITTSGSAGGHSIKFYSSVRIELSFIKDIDHIDRGFKIRDGQRVKIRVKKNKVNDLKLTEFEVNLLNDGGFDVRDSLVDAFRYIGAISRAATHSDTAPETVYTWMPGTENERKFKRREWGEIVSSLGGTQKAYDYLYEIGKDIILPYGTFL